MSTPRSSARDLSAPRATSPQDQPFTAQDPLTADTTITDGESTYRSRAIPTGWRMVVLVGILSLFGPLCIDMYLPGLPEIHHDLRAGPSAVQFTLTTCLIGIAFGQLAIGPISDRLGRRPPLLAGLAGFAAASVACAFAPNLFVLAAFRLIQGLGGAAGMVISRSIVRDLHSGTALIRFFSTLMLMTGLGPLIAPQLGGWILSYTSWRGIFIALAGIGLVLLAIAWRSVPETLAPASRSSGRVRSTVGSIVAVCRDRIFMGYALACAVCTGAAFVYIAGSSFVLQYTYRLSPTTFGVVFALNACGMIVGAQVNAVSLRRFTSRALLTAGLVTIIVGACLFLMIVITRAVGLVGVIPALFFFMFGLGSVGPNCAGLALERYPHSAGAASAVFGFLPFFVGATVAPLAGVSGTSDPLPMALLMATLPLAACGILFALAGRPASGRMSPGPAPS
jgi:MFS transporter, DHA1 family, multidrug resistance protein